MDSSIPADQRREALSRHRGQLAIFKANSGRGTSVSPQRLPCKQPSFPQIKLPLLFFHGFAFFASRKSLNVFSLFLARCFIAALRTRYTAAFLCCSQSNIAAISFVLLSELYFWD